MKITIRRSIGYLIDLVTAFLFYLLFFSLVGLLLKGLDAGKSVYSGLRSHLENISKVEDQLFTWLAFFVFLVLQDWFLKNKSLSRIVTGMKLSGTGDGRYPGFKKIVIRNLVKSLFFVDLVYFIFSGRIAHDQLSGTTMGLKK